MLDDLFGAFDQAALELGVEKIKTLGDSYMAVCGLPYANSEQADQVAALSLKIIEQLQLFNRQNGTRLKMRVGAHSGVVVAGWLVAANSLLTFGARRSTLPAAWNLQASLIRFRSAKRFASISVNHSI